VAFCHEISRVVQYDCEPTQPTALRGASVVCMAPQSDKPLCGDLGVHGSSFFPGIAEAESTA
jgi:hypothetical protein